MSVREFDLLTNTITQREYTQAELDALAGEASPAPVITLTARQFLAGLVLAGFITEEEAVNRSVLPASIAAVFGSLPPQQAIVARITWANMTVVLRDEPLVAAAAVALNQTPEQIDAFFAMAATL